MPGTDATLEAFFSSPKYAVEGAFTNPDKFGHKVFKWYTTHNLDVKPINPVAAAIKVHPLSVPTLDLTLETSPPPPTGPNSTPTRISSSTSLATLR